MIKGGVFVSKNEAVALMILDEFREGKISRSVASNLLGCSERAITRRIKKPIALSGSDVYISGYSTSSTGIYTGGYWKNAVWTSLPFTGMSSSMANNITIIGADVYIAGHVKSSIGIQIPGYWKNGTWSRLEPLDFTRNAESNAVGH